MSQVVRAIEVHATGNPIATGNRKAVQEKFSPLFQDVFSVKSKVQEKELLSDVMTQYRIGVTIGSEVWVSELDKIYDPDALTEASNRAKRHMIEAIFGEFRQDFMMIERALYDRDFQKARDNLRIFEQKMFGIE
jgi:hypothetical protein